MEGKGLCGMRTMAGLVRQLEQRLRDLRCCSCCLSKCRDQRRELSQRRSWLVEIIVQRTSHAVKVLASVTFVARG